MQSACTQQHWVCERTPDGSNYHTLQYSSRVLDKQGLCLLSSVPLEQCDIMSRTGGAGQKAELRRRMHSIEHHRKTLE